MNQSLQIQQNCSNNSELETSRLAVASFLIAIISFVHLFGFEKAMLGLILGLISLRETAGGKKVGRGYAVFAIVLSIIYILILISIYLFSSKSLIPY